MKKIKIQAKYNLLQALYGSCYCCLGVYSTAFLQWKRLNSAQIGIVTGVGYLLVIFTAPLVTWLLSSTKWLDLKKLYFINYSICIATFIVLAAFKLSDVVIICLHIFLIALFQSTAHLITIIGTENILRGEQINYGFARGFCSVAYAVGSLVMGKLIDTINAGMVVVYFSVFMVLYLIMLHFMPVYTPKLNQESSAQKAKPNYKNFFKTSKHFFFIILGFALLYVSFSALNTYLIIIFHDLGGSTAMYGMAVFFSTLGEFPFLAKGRGLAQKYGALAVVMASGVAYSLRNLIVCNAGSLVILIIGLMLHGLCSGLQMSGMAEYSMRELEPEYQAMSQTLITILVFGIGSSSGNYIGGNLIEYLGMDAMLLFAGIASLAGTSLILFTGIVRSVKKKAADSFV